MNGARSRSPKGKFPANTGGLSLLAENQILLFIFFIFICWGLKPIIEGPFINAGEWKRMSLPAMLVGETLGEILQASQFARDIVSAVARKTDTEDPKTPVPPQRTNQKGQHPENTQLQARRKREKQTKLESARSEPTSPSLGKARSRINFKVSPQEVREFDKENNRHMANRVSPRNKPWAKKTVLFPNPLFLSVPSSQQHKFCKTRSPVISRNRGAPHKFLIKSPPSASKFQSKNKSPPSKFQVKVRSPPSRFHAQNKSPPSKFQVKIKSPPVLSISSPTRPLSLMKKTSPKRSAVSKLRRSFSPSRLATRLASLSPLKGRRSVSVKKSDGLISGLKQRPPSTVQFPARRI